MGFVLLGGEKMRSFFPLVHVVVPEKKRIKYICLIRREKLPLFFHWPPPPRLACIELSGRKTLLSYYDTCLDFHRSD